MLWNPLNPLLNLLYWKVISGLQPILFHLFYPRSYTMLYCSPFHPKPAWLNSIEIWRVCRPYHLYNLPEIIDFSLMSMCMTRSVILLDYSIRMKGLTVLCKGEKLLLKDNSKISILIDPSSSSLSF
jgi:hypothetical protein